MPGQPIPTNGHKTRTDAIIEMYEDGVQQKLIAARLGCSTNAVSQAIFNYRKRTGRIIQPRMEEKRVTHLEPDEIGSSFQFGWKSYQKSVRGAREALAALRMEAT